MDTNVNTTETQNVKPNGADHGPVDPAQSTPQATKPSGVDLSRFDQEAVAAFQALNWSAERIAQTLKVDQKKTRANSKVTLKVSSKGAISVYGMGRFPTTLYYGQWVKLFKDTDNGREILAFADANRDSLSFRDEE